MTRQTVGRTVNCHRADAHLIATAHNADGYLATVGYQNFSDHFVCSKIIVLISNCKVTTFFRTDKTNFCFYISPCILCLFGKKTVTLQTVKIIISITDEQENTETGAAVYNI